VSCTVSSGYVSVPYLCGELSAQLMSCGVLCGINHFYRALIPDGIDCNEKTAPQKKELTSISCLYAGHVLTIAAFEKSFLIFGFCVNLFCTFTALFSIRRTQ
jgi:hypothetical protein